MLVVVKVQVIHDQKQQCCCELVPSELKCSASAFLKVGGGMGGFYNYKGVQNVTACEMLWYIIPSNSFVKIMMNFVYCHCVRRVHTECHVLLVEQLKRNVLTYTTTHKEQLKRQALSTQCSSNVTVGMLM